MKLILTDQIPSGKNAQGTAKNGHKYAKPRFKSWREAAAYEINQQKRKWTPAQKMSLPLLGDLVVTISYREIDKVPADGTRDLPGMQDALWYELVACGLIENDGQIKGVKWQYPWRTEGPCVELEIAHG